MSREHWNSTAIKNAVSQRININLKLVKHIELHYVKYMTEGNASNQDTQNGSCVFCEITIQFAQNGICSFFQFASKRI